MYVICMYVICMYVVCVCVCVCASVNLHVFIREEAMGGQDAVCSRDVNIHRLFS